MWKQRKSKAERAVRYCERCGRVCDVACRRSALRERALRQQMWVGPWV
jgi:hypothetical protein